MTQLNAKLLLSLIFSGLFLYFSEYDSVEGNMISTHNISEKFKNIRLYHGGVNVKIFGAEISVVLDIGRGRRTS